MHHILATQLVLDCKTNAQSRITHTLWTRFHTGLHKPIAMKHLDSHNNIFVNYILIMTLLMLVILDYILVNEIVLKPIYKQLEIDRNTSDFA